MSHKYLALPKIQHSSLIILWSKTEQKRDISLAVSANGLCLWNENDSKPDGYHEIIYLYDLIFFEKAFRFFSLESKSERQTTSSGEPAKARAYMWLGDGPEEGSRVLADLLKDLERRLREGERASVRQRLTFLVRSFLPSDGEDLDSVKGILAIRPLAPHLGAIAFMYLACGDLGRGWLFYDATKSRGRRAGQAPFPQPFWCGESLEHRNVVVWRGPGPGDEIMYASALGNLIEQSGHVWIEADDRLVALFSRSFPSATVIPRRTPPIKEAVAAADLQTTYAAVARHLRPTLEAFPSRPGYLIADPRMVSTFRERFSRWSDDGLVAGIAWRAGRASDTEAYNMELGVWIPVLTIPGVRFVSLLYDDCEDEVRWIEDEHGIQIEVIHDLDMRNDIEEVAALTAALDFVVGINTFATNLAGALGQRCFEVGPDWSHFYLGTDRSPWYPNSTVYLRRPGQPDSLAIDRMVRDLENAMELK